MARGLSATVKAYTGPIRWLAQLTTLKGNSYYFWDGERDQLIAGQTYKPLLQITEPFRRTRSLQSDTGALRLINVDKYVEALIAVDPFGAALCIVSHYLLGIETVLEKYRGLVSEPQLDARLFTCRLVPQMEPGRVAVHSREYEALCPWRFAKPQCGYDRATISPSVFLAEQTSDIVSATTIGKTTLAETVNAHVDRLILLTTGAAKTHVRRIKSNTPTTFTPYQAWKITPASGDKFVVFSDTPMNGAPKALLSATSAVLQIQCNIATARTIGHSGLAMVVDSHKSDGPEADAGIVLLTGGTGFGQERRIKGNTGTTITIADDESDFSPAPVAVDTEFAVMFLRCPKDLFEACEQRGLTHRFGGQPTLSPELTQIYSNQNPPVGGGGGGGGGGDDDHRRYFRT